MSNKHTNEKIAQELETFGFQLVEYIDSKHVIFICKCGNERTNSLLRIRQGQKCRSCKNSTDFVPEDTEDEKWKKFFDRWISSKGNVLLENGKEASIDTSDGRKRFTSNTLKKPIQINRAMVIAFKLENYEKIENEENLNIYEVAFKDGDKNNMTIDNLIVVHKSDNFLRQGKFNERANYVNFIEDDIKDKYEFKILEEYPKYKFYANGFIFKAGIYQPGETKNYCSSTFINNNEQRDSKKPYRLICMAFHPLPGKTKYDDYKELQVNHKDGNPQNNAADNLEWCTQSENQLHKNQQITKGNQQIKMLDATTKSLIREFISVAETARFLYEEDYGKFVETDDKQEKEKYRKKCVALETRVRDRAKGKYKQSGKYIFEYVDEEKREAFQEKYSKHIWKKK